MTDNTEYSTSRYHRSRITALRMLISVFKLCLKEYSFFRSLQILRQIGRRKRIIQGFKGMPRFVKNRGKIYYELNTPGWPSPAFSKFFSTEIKKGIKGQDDTELIQNAVISVSSKCPLNCSHCFEWDRLQEEEKLSHHEVLEISRKLQEGGATIIQVGGGEPLMRLAACITLARESGAETDFWLITSAFGLDRFKTEFLKISGYTGINISLDHWDPLEHNAFRGNDLSFRWVIDGAENTIRAGLLLCFSLCAKRDFITEKNLNIYLELVKELGGHFIQILEPRATGRWKDEDVRLDNDQLRLISEFRDKVNSEKRYAHYPVIIFHGGFQRSHGCLGASNRYLFVDSAGDVHACPFCQQPHGNLVNQELGEILPSLRQSGCQKFKEYERKY